MKNIIWSWHLLLVLAGGILFMVGMGNIGNENVALLYVLAAAVVGSTGAILYARMKDKRDGKRFIIYKRRGKKPNVSKFN